jgi:tRNA threonylcarbamoyladenosine biosynthesis protein TsaE
VGLHVSHLAVKTVGKPREQARFGRGEIDTGHADLGESELARPAPDLRKQERTVALTAVEHHPPIVGTLPSPLAWQGEDDTRAFAERLARHPAIADAFIALHGELGAGKTTFVRHLLRALGAQGRIKSPTYAVVEPYELPGGPAWHFDFYRFDDPREWEDAGFRDIFAGPGLKIAEWPQKAAAVLPPADLDIHIALADGDARQVTLRANTPRGRELLQ